jgi:hypothetical protein
MASHCRNAGTGGTICLNADILIIASYYRVWWCEAAVLTFLQVMKIGPESWYATPWHIRVLICFAAAMHTRTLQISQEKDQV